MEKRRKRKGKNNDYQSIPKHFLAVRAVIWSRGCQCGNRVTDAFNLDLKEREEKVSKEERSIKERKKGIGSFLESLASYFFLWQANDLFHSFIAVIWGVKMKRKGMRKISFRREREEKRVWICTVLNLVWNRWLICMMRSKHVVVAISSFRSLFIT